MNIYSPYLDFAEKFKFNFRDSSGFNRINDDELMMIDVTILIVLLMEKPLLRLVLIDLKTILKVILIVLFIK